MMLTALVTETIKRLMPNGIPRRHDEYVVRVVALWHSKPEKAIQYDAALQYASCKWGLALFIGQSNNELAINGATGDSLMTF